jgi:CBS domain-containing protein
MLQRDVQVVPVVDEAGRPLGMVSSSDLVADGSTAADVMRPIALVLSEAETVWRAAALMAREGIRRAPVVGSDGRVVGMVSSLHLTRWLARGGPLEGQG